MAPDCWCVLRLRDCLMVEQGSGSCPWPSIHTSFLCVVSTSVIDPESQQWKYFQAPALWCLALPNMLPMRWNSFTSSWRCHRASWILTGKGGWHGLKDVGRDFYERNSMHIDEAKHSKGCCGETHDAMLLYEIVGLEMMQTQATACQRACPRWFGAEKSLGCKENL